MQHMKNTIKLSAPIITAENKSIPALYIKANFLNMYLGKIALSLT